MLPLIGFAQLNANLIGDAVSQGNNCYIITPDQLTRTGGAWFDNAIDFDTDFTIDFTGNFGNKDTNGADGMALVFKTNPTAILGNSGGGMAYEGISTSLIVEFDTFQNSSLGDPFFDHIAVQTNGIPNHLNPTNNLAGPVQASSTNPNIEDNQVHNVRIEWNATSNVFSVFFDCILRLSFTQDLKSTVFNNANNTYIGFVGSTGGLSNLHQLCFNGLSFIDNLVLQDQDLCAGGITNIDASITSGVSYSWSPTNGISNPNIANPTFGPLSTTTYTVTITDVCSDTTTEDVTINVLPITTPIFNPVNPICNGETLNPLPLISNNGTSGTWSPILDNTTTTTYNFTPSSGECANPTSLTIVVDQPINPTFGNLGPFCNGDIFNLPSTSIEGIPGVWSPAINNTTTTTYTFTPDNGQCANTTTLTVTINQPVSATFTTPNTYCENDAIPNLPTTSLEGFTGNWTPAINNTITTTYTFTPDTGQCASISTFTITIEPPVTPTFSIQNSYCENLSIPELPITSNEGITGSWSPSIDNINTTTYTFTPDNGECANIATQTITITQSITPTFNPVGTYCENEIIPALDTISNEGVSGSWSPAINSTATTTYTFTPDNGECANIVTTVIDILPQELPLFDPVDPICTGDSVSDLPTISLNGISGSWSPAINNTATTTYTFTPNAGICASNTTITIVVDSGAILQLDIVVRNTGSVRNATGIVSNNTGVVEYQLNNSSWQTNPEFCIQNLCGEQTLSARLASGCSETTSTTFIATNYADFFTPNQDGFNDSWNLECLRNNATARIYIFDRHGKLLKNISADGFGWDGTYQNNPMPSSDYWFKATYLDNAVERTITGHFTLKR